MLTFVNLTAQLGPFTPTLLIYHSHLQELDISGCTDIDATLFVDCIGACKDLKKLCMSSCKQFTQYHILKFVSTVPKLSYFEFANTSEISYCNALAILGNLHMLESINFDPMDIANNVQAFRNLMRIFRKVNFGVNIVKHYPLYGIRSDIMCEET